ncbi:MAG: radical SAM protein [Bryobacterales bacterium]|nr:radical SAM protein [Bryobacterales bacterium]
MRVALVNTNRVQPPIAPIGLDYVAEALAAAGDEVSLLDLCWEPDPAQAVRRFFNGQDFGLAGITLRNTDDCGYLTRHSFLPEFVEIMAAVRAATDAKIVVGGVGFSVMPEAVLGLSGADAGIWGDGEFAFAEMARLLESGQDWRKTPGLIWCEGAEYRRTAPVTRGLGDLPAMRRRWVDNRRYFEQGGQAGFEGKRGCGAACVYCADPAAKGRTTRVRPAAAVADEVEQLLAQGIDHLHTCDSEFNLPPWHAHEVCEELARRGVGGRLRWYAYCAPAPFSRQLASAMQRAGCAGINFGADSGDPEMLARLGRGFKPEDILNAARWTRECGMAVMLDLLLGAPGETAESLARTVELVRKAEPDRAGVSVGVRVYPGTRLAESLPPEGAQSGFFLEPAVAPFIFKLLDELIGDDGRFLFFDPGRPEKNYNYNANRRLTEAIRTGYRGAYWDILRRYGEEAG